MTGTPGSQDWRQIGIHTLDEMADLLTKIFEDIQALELPDKDVFGVRLALEEALVNAVKHGNRMDPSKTVHVRYQVNSQQFTIEIRDEGSGFDPNAVPDPLDPENLERPGGRGVFLMRHYMTTVEYNASGNCVTLSKARPS